MAPSARRADAVMSRCNLCRVTASADTFVEHLLENALMTFEHKAQLDSARLKDAFGEVARDYKLMLDGFKRGVRVSANSPVRICVITDGVHWVFVRCRELMVDRVRRIVLEPSRVFEFDNLVPVPPKPSSKEAGFTATPSRPNARKVPKVQPGTDKDRPSVKTCKFLHTLWAAMRFNLAQKTMGVFSADPEKRFVYEKTVGGERVRVVDIISDTRSVVVRAMLQAAAVGVAATTSGGGGGGAVASAGDAPVVATVASAAGDAPAAVTAAERSVIIKFADTADCAPEHRTWVDLLQRSIPHLVARVDCALSKADNVLVMEDCGVALEYFCVRDDKVRARVKQLLNDQIAVALNAMHQIELAFVDLHPGNVIVVPSNVDGDFGVAALKLIDFESVLPFGANKQEKAASPVRAVNGQTPLQEREKIDASFDQERFAFVHRWVELKGEVSFKECFVQDWQSKWPKLAQK